MNRVTGAKAETGCRKSGSVGMGKLGDWQMGCGCGGQIQSEAGVP